MDPLVTNLIEELESYITNGRSADGFPNDTLLSDGQSVKLLSVVI
jgi:hypothetical protein